MKMKTKNSSPLVCLIAALCVSGVAAAKDKTDSPLKSAGVLEFDRIAVGQHETQWRFAPFSPWSADAYLIQVASILEDVSGNNVKAPFDVQVRSEDNPHSDRDMIVIPVRLNRTK